VDRPNLQTICTFPRFLSTRINSFVSGCPKPRNNGPKPQNRLVIAKNSTLQRALRLPRAEIALVVDNQTGDGKPFSIRGLRGTMRTLCGCFISRNSRDTGYTVPLETTSSKAILDASPSVGVGPCRIRRGFWGQPSEWPMKTSAFVGAFCSPGVRRRPQLKQGAPR
jgi:hypothetical protein